MEFDETDRAPLLENKKMIVVRSHDEQISFLIIIAVIIDDMLPFSPHNVLQLIVRMLMHRQVPTVFQNVGNIKFLCEVPDMHLSKLQVIRCFLQCQILPNVSTLWGHKNTPKEDYADK